MAKRNESSASAAKPRRRWIRILLVIAILLAVALWFAPNLIARFGEDYILDQLRSRIDGSLEVGSLEMSWGSGLHVAQLRITAAGAPEPSIEVGHLELKPHYLPLLGGDVHGTAVLTGVHVRARRRGGILDLGEIMKPSESAEPAGDLPGLDLEVSVRDLNLVYSDDALPESSRIEEFDLVEAHLRDGEPLSLVLRDGEKLSLDLAIDLIENHRVRPAERISAEGRLQVRDLDLQTYAAAAAPWVATLVGSLSTESAVAWSEDRLRVSGPIRISGARLGLRDGSGEQRLDDVAFAGLLDLDFAGMMIEGEFETSLRGVRLAGLPGLDEPLVLEEGMVKASIDPKGDIRCETIRLRSDALSVDGSADISRAEAGLSGSGNLDIKGDVAKLAALVGGLPTMSGRLGSQVRLSWTPDGTTSVAGTTRIDDLVATGLSGDVPEIREKAVVLEHDLSIGARRIEARQAKLVASFAHASVVGALEFAGEGEPASGKLEVKADADLARIAALLGERLGMSMSGRIAVEGSFSGLAEGFGIAGSITGQGLRLEGGPLRGEPLRIDDLRLETDGEIGSDGRSVALRRLAIESSPAKGELALAVAMPEGAPFELQAVGQLAVDPDAILGSLMDRRGEPRIGQTTLDAKLRIDGREMAFDKLQIQAAALAGSVTGRIVRESEGKHQGSLKVDLRGDLARLGSLGFFALPVSMQGTSTLKGDLTMGETATFTGFLSGAGLVFSGGPIGAEPLRVASLDGEVKGSFDESKGIAAIEKLHIVAKDMLDLELTAPARIEGLSLDGTPQGRITGKIFCALHRIPAGLLQLPEGMALAGETTVSGSVGLGEGGSQSTTFDAQLSGRNLIISGNPTGSEPLRLATVTGEAAGSFDGAAGALALQRAKLATDPFAFELTAPCRIEGLSAGGAPEGRIAGRGRAVLNQLPRGLMPPDLRANGSCSFEGSVDLAEILGFDARLEGQNLVFAGGPLGAETLNLGKLGARAAGRHSAAAGWLELSSLSVQSDAVTLDLGSPARIEGLLEGQTPRGALAIKGTAVLERLPGALLGLPPDLSLGGRTTFDGRVDLGEVVAGNLNLRSDGFTARRPDGTTLRTPLTLTARSDPGGAFDIMVQASGLGVERPGQAPVRPTPFTVQARGRRPAQGPMELQSFSIDGAGIKASGSARLQEAAASHLKVNAALELDRVSTTLLAVFAPTLRTGGAGRLDLDLNFAAQAGPWMRRASGTWSANLARFETDEFLLTNVVISGRVDQGLARISQGNAGLNGGTAQITGTADFRGDQPVWNTQVIGRNVVIEERLQPAIARVIPLFAGLGVKVTARADADIQMQGRGSTWDVAKQTLTGGGLLSLSEGSVVGGPIIGGLSQLVGGPARFDFLPFQPRFNVRQGRVHQQGVTIASNLLDLRIGGSTGLDGTLDQKLGVRVKGQGDAKWQRWTSVLGTDGFLPIGLGGTLSAPSLQPPKPEELIGGAAQDLIKRGLGGLLGPKKDDKKKDDGKNDGGR